MANAPQLQPFSSGPSLTPCPSRPTAPKLGDDMVIEIDPEKRDSIQGGNSLHGSSPDADTNDKGRRKLGLGRLCLWGRYLRPAWIFSAFHEWQRRRNEWWDGRFKEIRHDHIDDYPCGYPQLAAVINSDVNFRVYRRFGTLHNRVLLHRQYELVELEEELQELDIMDSIGHKRRIQSIQEDHADPGSQRQALIDKIDQKLEHYDKLLLRERESVLMNRPTPRNHRSVIHYLWNEKPIVQEETKFMNRVDDFVILTNEQDSPFHTFVERMIQRFATDWFRRLFATKSQREATKSREINLYSKKRIGYLVHTIITIIKLFLLMTPVCLLFFLDSSDKIKIIIVLVFLLLFPAAISLFTRAKNHELFAVSAAYCAILVVFLGNFTGSRNGSNA